MTNTELVRASESSRRPSQRRWLPAAIVAALLIAIIAVGAWWLLAGRSAAPDWDRVAALDLKAPTGDAFDEKTPWVMLHLAPGKPGATNTISARLVARTGTPIASAGPAQSITEITAQHLVPGSAPESLPLQPASSPDGTVSTSSPLDGSGWWHLRVTVDGAARPADYYVLLPDPNINGPAAVPTSATTPEAEAVYARGMQSMTSLQDVQFTQWMADGQGNGAISYHAVHAGGDGTPGGFIFKAAGGMEAVVIDSTRWVKLPGTLGWDEQEGALSVPPSEWGEEYQGATGFTLIGEETIDGERTQLVAFTVPEVSEPRRQIAAWYIWWVGVDSGEIRREAMVSRLHYMLNEFSGFNEPFALAPPGASGTPVTPATSAAGTPAS
jgi:hypothetical protein